MTNMLTIAIWLGPLLAQSFVTRLLGEGAAAFCRRLIINVKIFRMAYSLIRS